MDDLKDFDGNVFSDGVAYMRSQNVILNVPGATNFCVIRRGSGPLTLAHEALHVLEDRTHTIVEPFTALFRKDSPGTRAVHDGKRIGPYVDPSTGTQYMPGETRTLRRFAETLP